MLLVALIGRKATQISLMGTFAGPNQTLIGHIQLKCQKTGCSTVAYPTVTVSVSSPIDESP